MTYLQKKFHIAYGPVSYTHLDVYKRQGKAYNFRPIDGVNWAGVIAWALGAAAAYFVFKIEFSGIIAGFVIYLIAERFIPSSSRDKSEEDAA